MSIAGALVVAAVAFRYFQTLHPEPWQFLAQVRQLEQAGNDGMSVQMLAWNLAILGRDDEVRGIDFYPGFTPPRSARKAGIASIFLSRPNPSRSLSANAKE